MPDINLEDRKRILEVFCPEYNKINFCNYSINDALDSFIQPVCDVDIRLSNKDGILDIQIVRPYGNPDLEYKLDAWRRQTQLEFNKAFINEGIKGKFSWTPHDYPPRGKMKKIVEKAVSFIKKNLQEGRETILFEPYMENFPEELESFSYFQFEKGDKYLPGFSWGESPIEDTYMVLNAVKGKIEKLKSDEKKEYAANMILIVHFTRSSFDVTYYLESTKKVIEKLSIFYKEIWVCQNFPSISGAHRIYP